MYLVERGSVTPAGAVPSGNNKHIFALGLTEAELTSLFLPLTDRLTAGGGEARVGSVGGRPSWCHGAASVLLRELNV